MSIYGTILSLGADEHEDGCAVYVETSPGCFDFSGKPCDCGQQFAPLGYQGSHVLPSNDDPCCGWVDVATIPDFIEREGREPGPHDWLRLSVGDGGGDACVVLTRPQVEALRDSLTGWLARTPEEAQRSQREDGAS